MFVHKYYIELKSCYKKGVGKYIPAILTCMYCSCSNGSVEASTISQSGLLMIVTNRHAPIQRRDTQVQVLQFPSTLRFLCLKSLMRRACFAGSSSPLLPRKAYTLLTSSPNLQARQSCMSPGTRLQQRSAASNVKRVIAPSNSHQMDAPISTSEHRDDMFAGPSKKPDYSSLGKVSLHQ